jgi:hypothetical protein
MKWPVSIVAGDLEVRFNRRSDRIEHEVRISGIDVALLASIEGNHDEPWPDSPPFQELTLEERDGRPVALLVGRSGTSYWSASVEPVAEFEIISFDIACRFQRPPTWLGSRYRISTHARFRLAITVTHGDTILHMAESNNVESPPDFDFSAGIIEIAPLAISTCFPATARWRFGLCVAGR